MAVFNFLFVPICSRVRKVYHLTLRFRYYDLSAEQKIKEQLGIRDTVFGFVVHNGINKGFAQ
jgi:hypothetical protein